MRALAVLLGSTLGAVLAGCATIGQDFDSDRARLLRKGMSRETVVAVIGEAPSSVEGKDSWRLVWLYAEADPIGFGVTEKRLSVSFDAKGRADRITVTAPMGEPAP